MDVLSLDACVMAKWRYRVAVGTCESGLSHIRGQKEEETDERASEVISDVIGKAGDLRGLEVR